MDRSAFMEQLSRLLSDISPAEREEALEYYENYFDDAGPENEAQVIRELGSPGKIAAIIKADLQESGGDYGEYTERGYEDSRNRDTSRVPGRYTGNRRENREDFGGAEFYEDKRTENAPDFSEAGWSGRDDYRQGSQRGDSGTWRENPDGTWSKDEEGSRERRSRRNGYHAKKKGSGPAILVLILLVFLSPFIKGAVGGLLGVLVTICLLPFLLIFAIGAVTFALLAAAVACIVSGAALLTGSLAAGFLTMGIGFLILSVGILFLILLLAAAKRLLPWFLRKITDFGGRLLHRRKQGM